MLVIDAATEELDFVPVGGRVNGGARGVSPEPLQEGKWRGIAYAGSADGGEGDILICAPHNADTFLKIDTTEIFEVHD